MPSAEKLTGRRPSKFSAGNGPERVASDRRSGLILLFLFLFLGANGGFSGLKANTAVSAVAKWLIDGTAATAERKVGFPREIVLMAVGVDELKGAFGGLHAERTVFSRGDFDLCHVSSGGVIDCDSASLVHLQEQIPRRSPG